MMDNQLSHAQRLNLIDPLDSISSAILEAEAALCAYEAALKQLNRTQYIDGLRVARSSLGRHDLDLPDELRAHLMEGLSKASRDILTALPQADEHESLFPLIFQRWAPLRAAVNVQIRAFVSALGRAGRLLAWFARNESIPEEVRVKARLLDQAIPRLREIRNSVEHIEDRERGLGPRQRPIPGIDGSFHIWTLHGNNYRILLEDGCYGIISVSKETIVAANKAITPFMEAMSLSMPCYDQEKGGYGDVAK